MEPLDPTTHQPEQAAPPGSRALASAVIVGACVLAACGYGILHDQITARVSVEYFTIGHPRIVPSEDPTVLGLVWGVVATWWVGLILGVGLALVAQAGSWPRRSPRSLVRPVAILLGCMGLGATLSGLIGRSLAERGVFQLVKSLAAEIPPEKHVAFLTAGWAHGASYLLGFLGGLVVLVVVARDRHRAAVARVEAEVRDAEDQADELVALVPPWARILGLGLAHLALLPQLFLTYMGLLLSVASVAGGRSAAITARLIALGFAVLVLVIARVTWRSQVGCARALSALCSLVAALTVLLALGALL